MIINKYTGALPAPLASYDFNDIASNLIFHTFYCIAQDEEALGTITYKLADTNTFYSNTTSSTVNTTTPSTYNFDTSVFNLPRTAKGTAIFQCTMKNNDADVVNVTLTVQLKKVLPGGSTVNLCTAKVVDYDGNTAPGNALGASTKVNVLLFLDLTQTIIKKGEKLRCAVTLDVKDAADSVSIYHDPLGRDLLSDTNFTTQMKLHMPFRSRD